MARPDIEELLRRFEEQQQASLQTLREVVHEVLAQPSASTSVQILQGASSTRSGKRRRRSTRDTEVERATDLITKAEWPTDENGKPLTLGSSVITGESDESDVEEEFYVQKSLPSYAFDHEDLRGHLKKHRFNRHGQELLKSVVDHGRLVHPTLFREYPPDEQWHISHYSVFDVGKDGAPLSRSGIVQKGSTIDSAIWQAIQVESNSLLYALTRN